MFLLAKDGAIVADDDGKVAFAAERVATDQATGKPVADVTRYAYADGDLSYVVTFERQRTILQRVFADKLPLARRALARLAGSTPPICASPARRASKNSSAANWSSAFPLRRSGS